MSLTARLDRIILPARAAVPVPSPKAAVLAYPQLLVQLYHRIRHSVPLMVEALPALGTSRVAISAYLTRHIVEETGHDEWVLEDLDALGAGRELVTRIPPDPAIVAAVGSQYYWIRAHWPIALLGYIYALEAHAPKPEVFLEWAAEGGPPVDALRTLLRHAETDQVHGAELVTLLDGPAVHPGDVPWIIRSAAVTVGHLRTLASTLFAA
jgi:hypothetical protein